MTIRHLWLALFAMAGSFFIAPEAQARCASLSFCSCTVSATGVSYGTYDPLSANDDDSTGTVRVRCSLLAALPGSFTVSLSAGASGSYGARTLRNGSSDLLYNLYTDATRSQVWGNGTGGSVRVSQSFAGLFAVDRTLTVYGRIEAGQNVPAGGYGDTIVVTVTY